MIRAVLMLSAFRNWFRSAWIAAAVAGILVSSISRYSDSLWPYNQTLVALVVFVMMIGTVRYGLLGHIAVLWMFVGVGRLPVTLDPSAWSFSESLAVLAVAMVVVVGAARLAVSSRQEMSRPA